MSASQSSIPLIGRLLIGIPFLIEGILKLGDYSGTIGYITSVGLPLPSVGWAIAVVIEIVFSSLLILGWRVRQVAVVMALFTLSTALVFHNNLSDQGQFINFIKNIMITGGLLQIIAFGGGALSLDARRRQH